MVNRDELLHWLHTLDRNTCIGIDEGGLCLREVTPDDTLGEAYFEIGGIPDGVDCPRCDRSGEEPGVPFDDRDGMAICSLCHGHGTLSFAEWKAYQDEFPPPDSVDRAERFYHVE